MCVQKILNRKKVHLEVREHLHPGEANVQCTLRGPGILLGIFWLRVKNFYMPFTFRNLSDNIKTMKRNPMFSIRVMLDFSRIHSEFNFHLVINDNTASPAFRLFKTYLNEYKSIKNIFHNSIMVKENWLCCSNNNNKQPIWYLRCLGWPLSPLFVHHFFLWLQYDCQQDVSLRASSPGRSSGGVGKGRRACNYVSGIWIPPPFPLWLPVDWMKNPIEE